VEDAIDSACDKLGYDRDTIEWEILDLPKKSFFGLKTMPARVKVWKDEPDQAAPSRQSSAPQRAQASERPQSRKAPPAAKSKPYEQPAPAAQRPPREETVIELTGEVAKKAELATAYLGQICEKMGLSPIFVASVLDGGICIDIKGEGLGAIIGRRGETLDALQYLSGLVANRMGGDYLRLTLDCGDYRLKRKSTLEALARKLSAQVLKTNTSKILEPMNPFERRIIHATVSEIEGVTSTSVGEEPNRKVIITSPTARPSRGGGSRGGPGFRREGRDTADRGDRGDRGDRNDRSRRPRRSGPPPRRDNGNRSSQGGTINTVPQGSAFSAGEPPKKPLDAATEKPLYAKLDLE